MKKITQEAYINEITKFIKEKTGINRFLSNKEESLIKKFYSREIKLDRLKKIIESEIMSYPQSKRKNFSVLSIEKKLSDKSDTQNNKKKSQKKNKNRWENIIERLNIPPDIIKIGKIDAELRDIEIEKRIIKYIWENLPEDKKRELQEEAKKEIKDKFIIQNIEIKKVLKSIIYRKLKEIYRIGS